MRIFLVAFFVATLFGATSEAAPAVIRSVVDGSDTFSATASWVDGRQRGWELDLSYTTYARAQRTMAFFRMLGMLDSDGSLEYETAKEATFYIGCTLDLFRFAMDYAIAFRPVAPPSVAFVVNKEKGSVFHLRFPRFPATVFAGFGAVSGKKTEALARRTAHIRSHVFAFVNYLMGAYSGDGNTQSLMYSASSTPARLHGYGYTNSAKGVLVRSHIAGITRIVCCICEALDLKLSKFRIAIAARRPADPDVRETVSVRDALRNPQPEITYCLTLQMSASAILAVGSFIQFPRCVHKQSRLVAYLNFAADRDLHHRHKQAVIILAIAIKVCRELANRAAGKLREVVSDQNVLNAAKVALEKMLRKAIAAGEVPRCGSALSYTILHPAARVLNQLTPLRLRKHSKTGSSNLVASLEEYLRFSGTGRFFSPHGSRSGTRTAGPAYEARVRALAAGENLDEVYAVTRDGTSEPLICVRVYGSVEITRPAKLYWAKVSGERGAASSSSSAAARGDSEEYLAVNGLLLRNTAA